VLRLYPYRLAAKRQSTSPTPPCGSLGEARIRREWDGSLGEARERWGREGGETAFVLPFGGFFTFVQNDVGGREKAGMGEKRRKYYTTNYYIFIKIYKKTIDMIERR
jgi:hypothetical protein